jgi:hypothetical protein
LEQALWTGGTSIGWIRTDSKVHLKNKIYTDEYFYIESWP